MQYSNLMKMDIGIFYDNLVRRNGFITYFIHQFNFRSPYKFQKTANNPFPIVHWPILNTKYNAKYRKDSSTKSNPRILLKKLYMLCNQLIPILLIQVIISHNSRINKLIQELFQSKNSSKILQVINNLKENIKGITEDQKPNRLVLKQKLQQDIHNFEKANSIQQNNKINIIDPVAKYFYTTRFSSFSQENIKSKAKSTHINQEFNEEDKNEILLFLKNKEKQHSFLIKHFREKDDTIVKRNVLIKNEESVSGVDMNNDSAFSINEQKLQKNYNDYNKTVKIMQKSQRLNPQRLLEMTKNIMRLEEIQESIKQATDTKLKILKSRSVHKF